MIIIVGICSQCKKRKQWAHHSWCATCEIKWYKGKNVSIELLDIELLDAYQQEIANDFIDAL